jgi:hypothetical protein
MTLAVEATQNPPEIQRRRFTLEEFERMSALGLISEQHAELLNGENCEKIRDTSSRLRFT